jgi:hypothetical protein
MDRPFPRMGPLRAAYTCWLDLERYSDTESIARHPQIVDVPLIIYFRLVELAFFRFPADLQDLPRYPKSAKQAQGGSWKYISTNLGSSRPQEFPKRLQLRELSPH